MSEAPDGAGLLALGEECSVLGSNTRSALLSGSPLVQVCLEAVAVAGPPQTTTQGQLHSPLGEGRQRWGLLTAGEARQEKQGIASWGRSGCHAQPP